MYAHSDEVALGAMRTLRGAGLRVPEDVAVVGNDDHPLVELVVLTSTQSPRARRRRRCLPCRGARSVAASEARGQVCRGRQDRQEGGGVRLDVESMSGPHSGRPEAGAPVQPPVMTTPGHVVQPARPEGLEQHQIGGRTDRDERGACFRALVEQVEGRARGGERRAGTGSRSGQYRS